MWVRKQFRRSPWRDSALQDLQNCSWLLNVQASPVAQVVKNLPAMKETWVQSLGWEDPLVKEMATHSSILAWEIPQAEEPGGLQSMDTTE